GQTAQHTAAAAGKAEALKVLLRVEAESERNHARGPSLHQFERVAEGGEPQAVTTVTWAAKRRAFPHETDRPFPSPDNA
ncbi:MAG: hypothetical protein ABI614_00930, partial [Planctomycetota bacterium]